MKSEIDLLLFRLKENSFKDFRDKVNKYDQERVHCINGMYSYEPTFQEKDGKKVPSFWVQPRDGDNNEFLPTPVVYCKLKTELQEKLVEFFDYKRIHESNIEYIKGLTRFALREHVPGWVNNIYSSIKGIEVGKGTDQRTDKGPDKELIKELIKNQILKKEIRSQHPMVKRGK